MRWPAMLVLSAMLEEESGGCCKRKLRLGFVLEMMHLDSVEVLPNGG